MLCGCEEKARMAHSIRGLNFWVAAKTGDTLLKFATLQHFRDGESYVKWYKNAHYAIKSTLCHYHCNIRYVMPSIFF